MINPEKSFNFHDYIEIFLRRIWYIIIPFVIIAIGTFIYALLAPKEYRANTLLLVIPQKVPETLVRPTVTSRIIDRIQSIGQEVTSRTRLEQIISELNLFSKELKSKSKEEVVESMRRNIQVDTKTKDAKDSKEGYFSISYIDKDPRIAAVVPNKLASLFIEENLKLREQQAQGTSEFLSIELNANKTKLEEQEKALANFKRQFMGELPEQRDANLKVFEQLQLLYQRIGETMRSAQDRKLIIQKQLADTELLLASAETKKDDYPSSLNPLDPRRTVTKDPQKDPQEIQLEQLKNQLADLQAKYTEKHPDIVIVKKRIADMEAKIEKNKLEKKTEEPITVSELSTPKIETKKEKKEEKSEVKLNPRYKEMESQLIAIELEITRLKEEEAKVKVQINQYRERIENIPVRELAMAQLTRDYQNTKDTYQILLKKNEEAQQAENLERRQKGEQFRVIDPARIPEKPFRPDIPKILLFGLLLGMGSGFGLAFFREQMDRSFRDAEDLETTLGFKVLANIPKIEKKAA